MRKKLFIPVILTAVVAVAGCILIGSWVLGQLDPSDTSNSRLLSLWRGSDQQDSGQKLSGKNSSSLNEKQASMDVAVVDPKGVSVFAGRTEPDHTVTVLADGKPVGKVKADDYGEWALEVDRGIKSNNDKITLRVESKQNSQPAKTEQNLDNKSNESQAKANTAEPDTLNSQEKQADHASQPTENKRSPATLEKENNQRKKSVAAVETRLMKDIEDMIDEAKREAIAKYTARQNKTTAASTDKTPSQPKIKSQSEESKSSELKNTEISKGEMTSPPNSSSSPAKVAATASETSKSSAGGTVMTTEESNVPNVESNIVVSAAKKSDDVGGPGLPDRKMVTDKVPVLIKFVYREATFTPKGAEAAALLAEYVNLKNFKTITLSGHADERGTDEHNMELSQQRLDVVAKYLKDRGFNGKVVLLPKGESEPFQGIDRTAYPIEEVYQLDRRVELQHRQ